MDNAIRNRPIRVMPVFGTRPEAIKLAPVIRELQGRPGEFETIVVVTAQHRDMLDQVLKVFEIEPDHDLDIMEHGQKLAQVTSRALNGVQELVEKRQPAIVRVQGDTPTVFEGALGRDGGDQAVGGVLGRAGSGRQQGEEQDGGDLRAHGRLA